MSIKVRDIKDKIEYSRHSYKNSWKAGNYIFKIYLSNIDDNTMS